MKYIELDGKDIQFDIKLIQNQLKEDSSVRFVYSGEGTLYDYIRFLNDGNRGLKNDDLYIFKLCYERKNLDLTYTSVKPDGTKRRRQIKTMSRLINELDGKTDCKIVVNTNDRSDLAFVVQQLIFLQYPLQKVDILLKKEVHDANKVKRFMQRVDSLSVKCSDAVVRLTALHSTVEKQNIDAELKKDKLEDIETALESCKKIQSDLEKATTVELRLAVAASKKTGKSVIVNCFIGEEIAPTDAELATPNNCIYSRSPDEQYHLRMDDEDIVQDFACCADIHSAIDDQFRKAQNDVEHGFALPDMHIGYVTEDNNFSSYTIYDTAGPDAAGAQHDLAAKRAIGECDVALFAIDYAKYLTKTEEEYLKDVKTVFEGQQKFHSLVFALNKTDTRYNDPKTLKSIISSVDFVRTRLTNISSQYGDCIIFPTSSLEYFNVLEAQAANVTELNAPVTDMKALKFAHRDVPALQWLHTHSENLEYYHRIDSFSADVFMQDSGMPALMNYVSYIATSKARDEIVNNITFQIDQQNKMLRTVLNTVTNLEALIMADEQQIQNIKNSIERYDLAVQVILQENITEDDLKALDTPNYLMDNYQGDLLKMISVLRESIDNSCKPQPISKYVSEEVRRLMWKRLSTHTETMKEEECKSVIDSLCNESDVTLIVQEKLKERISATQIAFNSQFDMIRQEIKFIGGRRQKLLKDESERTKQALEKEKVDLQLPELSDFEFDVPLKPINTDELRIPSISIHNLRFEDCFKKEGGFGAFVKRVITLGIHKRFELNISEQDFGEIFKKSIRPQISEAVCDVNDIPNTMASLLKKAFIDEYAVSTIDKFRECFKTTMRTQKSAIEQFRKSIDDRDKFKEDIDRRAERKKNICEIQNSIAELMEIWDAVIGEVQEAEEDGTD